MPEFEHELKELAIELSSTLGLCYGVLSKDTTDFMKLLGEFPEEYQQEMYDTFQREYEEGQKLNAT